MATKATTAEKPAAESTGEGTQRIPVDQIVPPEINRTDFGDLDELAESIKNQGLLQPITVAPRKDGKYDLIIGERRWRATVKAGFAAIEAKVLELDPVERVLRQLAENFHRKDVTPLERAFQLNNLMTVAAANKVKLNQSQAGARLGFKSQGQVSKYLTRYRLYTEVPAFKAAWDAGKVSLSEAVELGTVTKYPGKHVALVERVLHDGLSTGNLSTAVKRHKDQRAREIQREAKIKELADAGATIAPDDWAKRGGRRIDPSDKKALDLDCKQHASEPCHAVYVNAAAQVEPICMDPARHHPKGGKGEAKPAEQPARATGPVPATPAEPAAGQDAASPAAPTAPAGEQSPEPAAQEPAPTAAAPVEDAGEAPRTPEENAHEEALREAATMRRATLRAWLTGRRKLSRPVSDRYVFSQLIHIALDGENDLGFLRDVLGLPEDEDTDVTSAIQAMAREGEEQLRRVAVALIAERLESDIVNGDYASAMTTQHYALLTGELGYELSEAERAELDRPVPAGD